MPPAPIAIILPHSGLETPPELRGRIALTEDEIFNEADCFTDVLFDFRPQVKHWLRFRYARALVDVNRSPDAQQSRDGDGIIKRQTSYGAAVYHPGAEPDDALEQQLIARYWLPWHRQLAAIASDPEVMVVFDCHTMAARGPTAYHDPDAPRPRVGVGNLGDRNGERVAGRGRLAAPPALARLLAEELGVALASAPVLAPTGPDVMLNWPYWGGWDLRAHGSERQPWLMIELNRALYIGEQSGSSPAAQPDPALLADLRQRLWQAITRTVAAGGGTQMTQMNADFR